MQYKRNGGGENKNNAPQMARSQETGKSQLGDNYKYYGRIGAQEGLEWCDGAFSGAVKLSRKLLTWLRRFKGRSGGHLSKESALGYK